MKRREFITFVGGAAAWPVAARAQPERLRRVGFFLTFSADDPEGPVRIAAFAQELQQLGWTAGRNVRIDYRWGGGDADRVRRYAAELVALRPDVILANGASVVAPLLRETRTVPIVFVNVTDPVGSGFVASLARPGGNATGFTTFEYSVVAKWLEILMQIAPGTKRVAVLRDPTQGSGNSQLAAIQAVAPSYGIEVFPVDVRVRAEIERSIESFSAVKNGGLIMTTGPSAIAHRDVVILLAARHRLPAIYPYSYFVGSGGLLSYGPDVIDPYRRSAGYVDRILRGEKPGELPVQAPTKFELVINLKTAKALGMTVPPTLLALADEVIE